MSLSATRTSRRGAASRTAPAAPRSGTPGPHADAVLCQAPPVEPFSRILLSVRRHVAVCNDVARRDRVPRQNGKAEIAHRGELQHRKVAIAPFVARVHDLDADRPGVQFTVPTPIRHAGVEGPSLLRHEAQHRAVLIHHIVRRHARGGIAQPIDRLLRGWHTGVMQDQDVDRGPCRPFVLVRARQVANPQLHKPRSRLIWSQAALIRATFSLARAMNSAGTPRAARLSGWFSRINRFHVARISSPLVAGDTPSVA